MGKQEEKQIKGVKMKINIPFTTKSIVISLVNSIDGELLEILNKRYTHSYENDKYSYPSRIAAIQHLRRANNKMTLLVAKYYVDSLVEKHNIPLRLEVGE